ncbi:efflux RND transporter permease subunit [Promineifilum sp.]|uniref:efflux RND transporter permease subunit n=1 Tax=Promineifilum sp. TaxID=2664178 RepID=UPI0035ADABC3
MVRSIVESSLKLRFLVLVLATVLVVLGVTQLRSAPVDVYPEFSPPLVEIHTEALGLSASEVESLLTVPMEADLLNGVAWLDQIYSESVAGLSSILLVFEEGTDPIRARQMVQERLTQTFALPNVSEPPTMLQPLSTTSRVMMVGLSSESLSLIDLGVLARWNIKPRLMGIPGVANVAIWGQRERQLQVQVDPARLNAEGVTLNQIIETTGEALWVSPLSYLEASQPGTAGWIDTPNQRLSIRHLLPISSAEDLSKVAVDDASGLLLGDVANVVEDHQPLIGEAALTGAPGLLLVVEKFPGSNTLEVTRDVEAALAAMQPGLTGVQIDNTLFRPANYIEQALGNLRSLVLVGAALAAVVLLLFLWSWRAALVSILSIVLSLTAAMLILQMRGATFNVLVLAGLVIALGIIIDDAVIDVENIRRRLRQRREGSGQSITSTILEASAEMRTPIFYAVVILALVILPVFFMGGLAGAFFRPLAVSYTLAVLASLAVALIITPALSLLIMGDGQPMRRESPVVAWLQRAYTGFMGRFVHAWVPALIISALAIIIGAAALPFLNISLLPSLQQSDLLVEWEGPSGTSSAEMSRILAQASRELRTIPGVANIGSHVGRAITGDQIVGVNSGELWLSLESNADHDATVAAVEEVVAGYPGLLRRVETYQPERIGEALLPAERQVTVRVFGHELSVLRETAGGVQSALAGISGVSNVRADLPAEEPQVEIEVDLAAAERYQVKPGDVRRAAATLLSGLRVGNLYEEQKVFDVVVWGVPEIRENLTSVQELLIDTPTGLVPLEELAEVRIVPSPIIIRRDAVSRFVDVTATVDGRSVGAVSSEIQRRLADVSFPLEYHAEVLGASTMQTVARQRLIGAMVAAALGIILLVQAASGSWQLALLAFLTLPVALVGGLLMALLTGGLSLGSLFGLLALLGIATRNGIMLIARYQHLEQTEGEPFGRELVLRGAADRLAPIVITALATAAALLPVVVAGNIAGSEIIRPMAIVILGGLVTSSLLNLFVMPALYLRFGISAAPAPAPVMPEEGALA